ncbi:MAG: TonB family protein [Candidatus Omnitrophota bacterium]|jgi:TonB family protein
MSAENKIYPVFLSLSLVLHISFIGFPLFILRNAHRIKQPVEIVYIKKKPPEKQIKAEKRDQPLQKKGPVNAAVIEARSVLDRKKPLPEYSDRLLSAAAPLRPQMFKPQPVAGRKKVTLPPAALPSEGIGNPSYQNYYGSVREKIRRAAYDNYKQAAQGDVFISFIVSRDGSLKAVRIMDERSTGSAYLKETASRSVLNAAPFSKFPKELDYDELTFNVMISFEIE